MNTDDSPAPEGRDEGGRWKPGVSGNPRGRRLGSGVITDLRRQLMTAMAPHVVRVLFEAATRGDVTAARLLLERSFAPLKAVDQPLDGEVEGDTMAEKARAVVDAMSEGRLDPRVGAQMLTAMQAAAQVIEHGELLARLAAIEARLAERRDDE